VICLSTAEGAALGAAIQAAHASGAMSAPLGELCERWVRLDESTRCLPDANRSSLYRDQLDRQLALTGVLRESAYL